MASERRLGDRIATGIYRDPAWLDDAVLGDYLQAIWQPLVQAALRRGEGDACCLYCAPCRPLLR